MEDMQRKEAATVNDSNANRQNEECSLRIRDVAKVVGIAIEIMKADEGQFRRPQRIWIYLAYALGAFLGALLGILLLSL